MEWTDNFFGDYYLKTHLPVLTDEKTNDEISFIEEVLNLKKGNEILDIPSGHGRHAIALAKKDYRVTGIDNQTKFIEIAQENSKNLDNISFIKEDMRNIDYEENFDAVINMFTSFGYFNDKANFAFLKQMCRALKKGGKLLIDTVNREWTINNTEEFKQAWILYPPDNLVFIANNSFDIQTSQMVSEQAIIDKGNRYLQEQRIRLYTYTEIDFMLRNSGMEIIACYGDIYKTPYSATTSNMIVVAEKVK